MIRSGGAAPIFHVPRHPARPVCQTGGYCFSISLLRREGLPAMSSNVGLNTPRGSGTSGYVQRNQSYLRPRDPIIPTDIHSQKHQPRQPDQEILKHDRLREIEVKVFDLQVQLEDDE